MRATSNGVMGLPEAVSQGTTRPTARVRLPPSAKPRIEGFDAPSLEKRTLEIVGSRAVHMGAEDVEKKSR